MPTDDTQVQRHENGRVVCTITFTEEEKQKGEEKALHELGRDMEVDGFRKGHVPPEVVREKADPQKMFEQTVQHLLPSTLESLIKEHSIQPIIHPNVEAISREPLSVNVTFVEKPAVKLKKSASKIAVEPKEPSVDEKEIDRMIDYILDKHKEVNEVDRPAKEGDQVTMDFWGEDENGEEIDGIRTTGHQIIIGAGVLIPGFEDELKGLQKGDTKDFTLTFPDKYHAEQLQGKPVTFHVTVQKVEEVHKPELTDEFVKAKLGAETVQDLRKQVEESMQQQEKRLERQRQERQLFDKIVEATEVDLPKELIDDEQRSLMQEFQKQLEEQQISVEQWLQQSGKSAEEFRQELEEQAKKRLTLRLGIEQLVQQKEIDVADDEMQQAAQAMAAQAPQDQKEQVQSAYQKGSQAYEQLRWQKRVEKLIETMLG